MDEESVNKFPYLWICECGKQPDPQYDEWAWDGKRWQHYHAFRFTDCVKKEDIPNALKSEIEKTISWIAEKWDMSPFGERPQADLVEKLLALFIKQPCHDKPAEPERDGREELVDLLREQCEWWKQDGNDDDEYINGIADALLAAGWRRRK